MATTFFKPRNPDWHLVAEGPGNVTITTMEGEQWRYATTDVAAVPNVNLEGHVAINRTESFSLAAAERLSLRTWGDINITADTLLASGTPYVPALTADVDQGWTAAASSIHNASFEAWRAFAGVIDAANYWLSAPGGVPATLSIAAPEAITVFGYDVGAGSPQARYPSDWTFQGSDDGAAWTTLDTQTGQTIPQPFQVNSYTLPVPQTYKHFQLNITANNGDTRVAVGGFQLKA